MLKQSFSILFLFAFILQVLYLPSLSIYLTLNQVSIAEKFCVNKLEPELLCSGRCYISSITSEALGDEDSPAKVPGSQEQIPITLMANMPHSIDILLDFDENRVSNLSYVYNYWFQPIYSIFHPPQMPTYSVTA